MSKIAAIFKKELKGFYVNPNFLLVTGLAAIVMSWLFPIQLSRFLQMAAQAQYMPQAPSQQLNIHYGLFMGHLSYVNLMLIFVVPALTMRLFAEERKLKTLDLLMTSPITSAEIVVGKYLAALGAVFFVMVLAFLYPATISIFAKLNWVPLIIAFFGIFALGSIYAAMDLFCSSLTESAIVAYIMAVLLNISIWFIGMGVQVADGPLMRQIFEHISLNEHLISLVEGTIRTNSLVFFSSLIFLFCFLAERVVESSRWR